MLAALLLSTWTAAAPAPVKPSTQQFQFAIARGSLASALEQFTRQTGLEIGTQIDVAENNIGDVGPFVGKTTADVALSALLKNTRLSHTWQETSLISIFVVEVHEPTAEDRVNEVLVTGTRLPDENGPVVRVYGRRTVDEYGITSVPDLSRYLPQQPFAFSNPYQSGGQFFQLRGLGFDTTLVLINGRRVPPSANSISLNAVDMNIVPLKAVDRIEVMSDSASAIYGADAVGGVVNVIMRNEIKEPEVFLHYGQADGGGTQRSAAAALGFANENLKSTFVLDYYDTTALMGSERELWRDQNYSRFGGRDYRVSATHPGNVYSLTSQPLPGLVTSRAAVPFGATGNLARADFRATDGMTNLESPFSQWSITPPSRRSSAYGSIEYALSDKISLFGEALAAHGELTALRPPPSVYRQIVPSTNPFNPFGESVAVDYSFEGMDPVSYIHDRDVLRGVAGARGAIDEWEWEVTGMRHGEDGATTTHGALDYTLVSNAVHSSDPQNALNLFSDGPAGTPELLSTLVEPSQQFSFSFASWQLSAFMRGPVFKLGERQAHLALGGEFRHDAAGFVEADRPIDESRDIASLFSEIKVPLLEKLSLRLAARGDDYSGKRKIVNPQYGITWQPVKDWLLRAAYGKSFRPPSLFELYMPRQGTTLPIADPLRGGEISNVALIVGGNRNLGVVTGESFTAGFVFNPSELPGVRLGASYWQVRMDNRIMMPIYQELLKADSPLTGRVSRDASGRLRSIDLTRTNYGDLDTSGVDIDMSLMKERDWGYFKASLAATWVDEYSSRDMNPVLPLDRVGIANLQGTIPEWRVIGTLSGKYRNFGASTTTSFTPPYQDADLVDGPLDRHIRSQVIVDFQTWAELRMQSAPLLNQATLILGVRNLFDRSPDFANAGTQLGYDVSQSDLTRRFIYFRINKRF